MPKLSHTESPNTFLKTLPVNPLKISSRSLELEMARRHLLDFTVATKPDYLVNWHHKLMCEYLERWAFGDIKRLMVFMPPRSGKSELVSRRLPAWLFGRNPDANVIGASYTADLASTMNIDVQRIMEDERYKEIFPNTFLWDKNVRASTSRTYKKNSDIFEIVNHAGVYKCAGIGGGITGRGFTHGIIDDPVKDRRDAESKTLSDRLYDWYTSTFYTRRMNDDARILITLTRWTQNDLAGRLIDLANSNPDAEQWTVVSFPMIAEDPITSGDPRKVGEALWPERFSQEDLKATRIALGSYDWSSLMQQRPTVSGGTIFDRSWWNYYHVNEDIVEHFDGKVGKLVLLPEKFDDQTQSWDLTFGAGTEADYVVGTVWGRVGSDKYLLDMYRKQIDFPETLKQFKIMDQKWPQANRKLVEAKANGRAMIDTLKHDIPGIIAVNPLGPKEVRARAAAPEVEAGNIFLPDSRICPWVHDLEDEFADFPNGRHDDICDTFTQYINNTRSIKRVVPPKVPSKIIRVGGGWS